LRDLFRWAQREAVGYEQLAANGYMLLAERVRRPEEKIVVKEALEKVMKVKLDMNAYYANLEIKELLEMPGPVIWTKAMRRLAVLVMTSMQNNEPLLLVGETGCGKTTVCQMIAEFFNKELIIVNAHQNTETGDLLGAQRPIRNRSELQLNYINQLKAVLNNYSAVLPEEISYTDAIAFWGDFKTNHEISEEDSKVMVKAKNDCDALFEWSDGPLVNALKTGSYFSHKPEKILPRDKAPEKCLSTILAYTNANKLISLSREDLLTQTSQLVGDFKTSKKTEDADINANRTVDVGPRSSGADSEWTVARGEAGDQ